jgi:acyl-CoA thioesterase FadM
MQQIYFFARDVRAEALNDVPAGYAVMETKHRMPVLKSTIAYIKPALFSQGENSWFFC